MANNANIRMIVKQTADGSTDSSELFTKGEFREHGGSFFIDYDESEATGYEGSHVQLRIGQQDDTVTMTRTGKVRSSLLLEQGRLNVGYYWLEGGELQLGVTTTAMNSTLTEFGGTFYCAYRLDVNSLPMSENTLLVEVTREPAAAPEETP